MSLRSPSQIATSEGMKLYWRKKKRAQPEQQLHKAVADYLRLALRPPTIWTTIGHGGGGKARGGQLKAMGVQPGWPDILVGHRFDHLDWTATIGIELKAGKGSQSPEQKGIQAAFEAIEWDYIVCRSIEDVQLALAHACIPIHATSGG